MMSRLLLLLCLGCAIHAFAPSTSAADRGPQFEEDDDAGSLPATSKKVQGNGPLLLIAGRLQGSNRGQGDYQDMYEILISQPGSLRLEVPEVSEGLNAQLFLFDADGRGLLANDDSLPGGGEGQPSLNPVLPGASTDGTDVVIQEPGTYYIAISGAPSRPRSPEGDIFFFNPQTPFEVSGPDGQGGGLPITTWGPPVGDTGSYVISLSGVSFLPPSPGACCLPGGDCVEVLEEVCADNNGTFAGDGVSCDVIDCNIGACCFLKEYCYWECLPLAESDCVTRYAATWYGPASKCEDISCPDPCYGACCVDGGCVLTVQALCDAQEGTFHPYTMCADVECQSGDDCRGDVNGDGTVNVLDLLDVIQNWGTCP
ncbi:MAG: hypothetical protein VX727_06550 [Planctomycetota bacterium]|nr:hypothetical protein [Planctomycetota bacterium]